MPVQRFVWAAPSLSLTVKDKTCSPPFKVSCENTKCEQNSAGHIFFMSLQQTEGQTGLYLNLKEINEWLLDVSFKAKVEMSQPDSLNNMKMLHNSGSQNTFTKSMEGWGWRSAFATAEMLKPDTTTVITLEVSVNKIIYRLLLLHVMTEVGKFTLARVHIIELSIKIQNEVATVSLFRAPIRSRLY